MTERGDFLPREMDNWNPKPVFVDGKYITKDTWYDADGKPFQPQIQQLANDLACPTSPCSLGPR